VRKRQRRLTGVDEIVLSLYAKGITTGEISAYFAEIYGASVSKETISRITDKVVAEMNECAPDPDATLAALDELEEKWGSKYSAMTRLWRNAWNEFVPFLDYDIEIRRMICSTNAIESLNARYRRAISARGFPHGASSDEVPVSCDPQPGPDRHRPHPMDDALETRNQRLRHHLR
jgi:transposase-like protein